MKTREEEKVFLIEHLYKVWENGANTNIKSLLLQVADWCDEHPISGEQIAAMKNEIKFLKRKLDECDKMYRELQNKNPWISVEERLPEEGKDILLSYDDGNIVRLGCVRIGVINFIKNHIQYYMCWMETPKPELKKE